MICSIILAAGNSSRFNSQTPKQFQELNGKLLLDYPTQTFSQCDEINKIIIVVPIKELDYIKKKYPQHKIVSGGNSRRESSFNGLIACPSGTKKVLIHDAARALIDKATILRCLKGLQSANAIATIIPVKDTIVKIDSKIIVQMPNRNHMYMEQTPQGFDYNTILDAHKKINIDVTDDIRLAKEAGIECKVVKGSENNFKITTQQDFQLAEIIVKGNK